MTSGSVLVYEFFPDGTYESQFGSSGTGNGEFEYIQALAIGGGTSGGGAPDSVAGAGIFLWTDDIGNRVEEFSATGTYEGQIGCASGACTAGSGNGELLDSPYLGITTDSNGNIWVADAATPASKSSPPPARTSRNSDPTVPAQGSLLALMALPLIQAAMSGCRTTPIVSKNSPAPAPTRASSAVAVQAPFFWVWQRPIQEPRNLAIDSSGNIWVADCGQ